MTIDSISQHMNINISNEELILPVDNHIVSLLIFVMVIGIDQLDKEADITFVLICNDVDHAVFVVEENALDFLNFVFIFDVQLHLLFDVYEEAIVFV